MYIWGSGLDGQLGLGDMHMAKEPLALDVLPSRMVSVSCGHFHTACVSAAGDLFTWGRSTWGRLGRPTDEVRLLLADAICARRTTLTPTCGTPTVCAGIQSRCVAWSGARRQHGDRRAAQGGQGCASRSAIALGTARRSGLTFTSLCCGVAVYCGLDFTVITTRKHDPTRRTRRRMLTGRCVRS